MSYPAATFTSWAEEKPGQFRVWAKPYGGVLSQVHIPAFDTLDGARRWAWVEQLRVGNMYYLYISRCSDLPGEFHRVETVNRNAVLQLAEELFQEAAPERFIRGSQE